MSDQQPRYHDPEWLHSRFADGWNMTDMAKECGVALSTINKWTQKLDVEYTPRRERQASGDGRYRDEKYLRRAYVEDGMTMPEIADACGCSYATVKYWMNEHGVERRSVSESMEGRTLTNEHRANISAANERWWSGLSDSERAAVGIAISNGLREAGVMPPGGGTGMNQSWRRSGRWRRARRTVVERDDSRCQSCSSLGAESDETFHVHHITPVCDGGDKYDLDNLALLCPDCHSAAHSGGDSA